MSKIITTKAALVFLIIASVTALIFAYISQFGFDLQPCILCLYQRKPFFAIIALASLAIVFFKTEKQQKIALFLCAIFLLINVGIASYHVGVEKKIFRGPSTCSSQNLDGIDDLKKLEAAIFATKAIRCDEPSFVFLTLSMAAWNVVYCISLLITTLTLFRRKN